MGYKKLISPEFRVTVGDYEVTDGIEVECFSSKESHMDWCLWLELVWSWEWIRFWV